MLIFRSDSERDWRTRQNSVDLSSDLRQSDFDEELEDAELVEYHGKTSQENQRIEENRACQVPSDVVGGEPG